MSKRLSLLERYEIDIEKLDYSYIESCNNSSELEKIYKILLSNEEGFYPDLTEAAKKRLATVKPHAKCLRVEEKVLSRESAEAEVQEEVQSGIGEFLNAIKRDCSAEERTMELPCLPIRGTSTGSESAIEIVPINQKGRDEMEKGSRITEIRTELFTKKQLKELEGVHRNKGNSFYRAKEYKEALLEYSQCIKVLPSANGFNNRAITYMKLKRFDEAIEDLDQCLALDSHNTKALLRKADIYLKLEQKQIALNVYQEICGGTSSAIEESCYDFAKEQIVKLERELQILTVEEDLKVEEKVTKKKESDIIDDDLAKLILPKKIVSSNSKKLMETFKEMNNNIKSTCKKVNKEKKGTTVKRPSLIQEI